ncbi:MAG: flavin reductase family protein [Deltaproteobacteria bacterium]
MSKGTNYYEFTPEMLEQLPRGAFLSVRAGEKINTMTIGWGAIGCIWFKPVLMVMVRYTRYTYELMEQASEFSVCVPLGNQFKKELGVAGTKSGRDIDKFRELDLTIGNGQSTNAPVIDQCGLVYECRTVFRQEMNPDFLDPAIKEKYYSDDNYHVLYFGEIVASYKNN